MLIRNYYISFYSICIFFFSDITFNSKRYSNMVLSWFWLLRIYCNIFGTYHNALRFHLNFLLKFSLKISFPIQRKLNDLLPETSAATVRGVTARVPQGPGPFDHIKFYLHEDRCSIKALFHPIFILLQFSSEQVANFFFLLFLYYSYS